eukprot:4176447-Amphidinium_carterae.1
MFVDSVFWARTEHKRWLDMTSEKQAEMERTFVLGSINPVPKASDTIAKVSTTDLKQEVLKQLRQM